VSGIFEYVDESGLLLTRDVIGAGFSKQHLYDFIKKRGFEKVSHGIYASSDAWQDEMYILALRCPQAIFSHEEALYYHGLIDREPSKKTITIYTGYGTGNLVRDGIKVYTVKKELLNIGKEYILNSFNHQVPIYNIERTICDLIRSRSTIEIQDYQTALKTYVTRKDKDLNRLMEYAKMFSVDRKIKEYMEVMI